MQKVVILTLGLLLIVGGFLFWRSQPKIETNEMTPKPSESVPTESVGSPSATGAMEEETVVTLTDKGFSPKTITVKKGTTVTFANEGTGTMWVASAPHPTHSTYPELDQKTAVGTGEMYQFTFDKVGSWKYHNHMNAADNGTIVVE